MHDTAPRLIGPPQHILVLEPISYQYHIAGTILHAPITNDWDANWLNVRMVARDGGRHWTRTEPALMTWDLQRLVNWLRAAADAELGRSQWMSTASSSKREYTRPPGSV